ncbi:hypothetical protein ABZ876_05745 [Streptomyces sp. NPDC046931]|uniref:SCO2400 family protein n=1 Tax=Streptomyces sp. NPDC046931 TaxID=3154806 RepID=UPI003407EDD0
MDYCSSCRRHLNGALVCPGCGAYAPDIAPPTAVKPSVPAAGTAVTGTARRQFDSPGTGHVGGLHGEHVRGLSGGHVGGPPAETAALVGMDDAPRSHPSGDVDGAPPASPGRAARRRQLARWKKNKRRAAVATAVALVGGGLTISALDRHSADRAQAATAPDDRPMGVAGEQTGEESRPGDPSSAPPGARRASPAPRSSYAKSLVQPPAAGVPHRQSTVTTPRTAAPDTGPDAAATPVPAQTSVPGHQAAAPVSGGTNGGGTGSAAQQPSTPRPPSTTAPANTGGGNSGTSQTNPAPPATSPAHLCLLVVCLG